MEIVKGTPPPPSVSSSSSSLPPQDSGVEVLISGFEATVGLEALKQRAAGREELLVLEGREKFEGVGPESVVFSGTIDPGDRPESLTVELVGVGWSALEDPFKGEPLDKVALGETPKKGVLVLSESSEVDDDGRPKMLAHRVAWMISIPVDETVVAYAAGKKEVNGENPLGAVPYPGSFVLLRGAWNPAKARMDDGWEFRRIDEVRLVDGDSHEKASVTFEWSPRFSPDRPALKLEPSNRTSETPPGMMIPPFFQNRRLWSYSERFFVLLHAPLRKEGSEDPEFLRVIEGMRRLTGSAETGEEWFEATRPSTPPVFFGTGGRKEDIPPPWASRTSDYPLGTPPPPQYTVGPYEATSTPSPSPIRGSFIESPLPPPLPPGRPPRTPPRIEGENRSLLF